MTAARAAAITYNCTGRGGNARCRAAHKAGRPVHIIPPWSSDTPTIVLPTYHYATEQEARAALAAADAAPIVTTDDELYAYRAAAIAHRLPVGWTDPTRRHGNPR